MRIKHLQLNTTVLQEPEKIFKFINENEIDLACLQEISYPIDGTNPLEELISKDELFYEEGLHFHYLPKKVSLGVGIFSRYPIVDVVRVYWNTDDYQPKNISDEDFLGTEIIEDDVKTEEFPGSRGIKHSAKSRCILLTTIQTPEGLIRVVTTHFTVSDLCTETTQMYDMASFVSSLIDNSKDLPTIFSADLNIRAKSYSMTKIKEVITCHTEDLKDTLANNHVAKEKDFPEGLAIDHVFSKGLEHISTGTIDVDFTYHKALVSEFEMG